MASRAPAEAAARATCDGGRIPVSRWSPLKIRLVVDVVDVITISLRWSISNWDALPFGDATAARWIECDHQSAISWRDPETKFVRNRITVSVIAANRIQFKLILCVFEE